MLKGKLFSFLLLVVLVLGACSNPDDPGDNGKDPNNDKEPHAAGDKFGGVLTVGMTADPDTLNPLVSNTTPGNWINSILYPHLMTMNENGEKVPYIAESIETSEDGLTVTIKLLDGLEWNDGEPLTSADVKFTGELLHEHELQWTADIFDTVKSVETPDDLTVVYTLNEPYVGFAGSIGYWVRIVPKHIWEKVDDPKSFDNSEAVGAGPFKLVEWKKGQYVELEAVDEWFAAEEGRAYLDKVIFRIFPDINTMVLALQSGEIDVTAQDIPVTAAKQLEASGNFVVQQTPSLGYGYYSFNLNEDYGPSPTKDKNFRLAMATATDRNTIIDVALEGMGEHMNSAVSPVLSDWVNQEVKAPSYDIEKAKQILADAGYKDTDGDNILNAPSTFGGENVELELMYNGADAYHQKTARILEQNASEIGVKLVLAPVEYNTLSERIFNERKFDMHIGKWGALEEPSDNMYTLFHSSASLNFMGLNDTSLDEILNDGKHATSTEKSKAAVFEFQEWFVEEFPVVPVYVQTFNLAYNKNKFEGFIMHPSDLQGLVDPNSLIHVYSTSK